MTGPEERLFSGDPTRGRTDALLVEQGGVRVLERYGAGVDETTTLRSWSMAKSMLHAVAGMLVGDGLLDLDAPAPVPQWAEPGDPRGAITVRHLLEMRSGLTWAEVYEADGRVHSDVVDMLFGNAGKPVDDVAAFAAARPLAVEPGTVTNYSSGTTSILSGIVRDIVGPGRAYEAWLRTRLFDPLGMTSATPKFDASGSWMASSYCFCTARDFASFGSLYLHEGMVDTTRLLSPEWVRLASTPTGRDLDGSLYSSHWWVVEDDPWGTYYASGYQAQHILVVPPLELVVVRLGETPDEHGPAVLGDLTELIASLA